MNENLIEEIKNQADIINKIKREAYQAGYGQGRQDERREWELKEKREGEEAMAKDERAEEMRGKEGEEE